MKGFIVAFLRVHYFIMDHKPGTLFFPDNLNFFMYTSFAPSCNTRERQENTFLRKKKNKMSFRVTFVDFAPMSG